ncbi:MAG TPA: MBL fold metallo-hydrolase, partial [Marinilabiliales bacterium]|nr:MBL fold metallo-hydrolase [Marinilabiliales bacterium]
QLVYCADLIPTMANVPLSFISAYDLFQLDVLDEKEKLLEAAAEHQMVLFFEHDLQTECCTVEKGAKGIVVKESFSFDVFKQRYH